MSTPSEEPTLHELLSRLAELEQAHARLHEELTHVRAERAPAAEEQTSTQTRTRPRRSSRRKVLEKGLGVAVASVGAGALLELSGGIALAKPIGPGVFANSGAGTAAVKASGTTGADGVDATSDSGTGVSATSGSGTGLVAQSTIGDGIHGTSVGATGVFGQSNSNGGTGVLGNSGGNGVVGVSSNTSVNVAGVHGINSNGPSSGLAGLFEGNVKVTGTLGSGAGTFASSVSSTPAVRASGTNGTEGVIGTSDTGIGVVGVGSSFAGVAGQSTSSGDGVLGIGSSGSGIHGETSGSGFAGLFDGNVQVNGNFSVTGTKAFVQAHPTDPGREIVYVALEGGEAGTYVRGTGQLQSGKAVVALPEHFGLVTDNEGLTIHLTPRGQWLQLYLVELDTAQIVVREAQGKSGAFDYLVHGVRRGYEQHEVIRTKR